MEFRFDNQEALDRAIDSGDLVKRFSDAMYGNLTHIVDDLGLRNNGINNDASLGAYFTGRKEDTIEGGFVGQVVYYFPGRKRGVYVNLPGGESGPFRRGDDPAFDIGTKRIWTPLSAEELKSVLTDGLTIIKRLMEEFN